MTERRILIGLYNCIGRRDMNFEIFLFGLFFSLHKPVARIFLRGGAIQGVDGPNKVGWGELLGCLRLHFECVSNVKTGCFSNF